MGTATTTPERIIPETDTERRLLTGLQTNAGFFLDATDIYPRRVTHHVYRVLRRWHRAGLVERNSRWISYHEQRDSWRLASDNPALLHDALVHQVETIAEERAATMNEIETLRAYLADIAPGVQAAAACDTADATAVREAWNASRDFTHQLWQLHCAQDQITRFAAREQKIRERAEAAGLDGDAILLGIPWGAEATVAGCDPLGGDA